MGRIDVRRSVAPFSVGVESRAVLRRTRRSIGLTAVETPSSPSVENPVERQVDRLLKYRRCRARLVRRVSDRGRVGLAGGGIDERLRLAGALFAILIDDHHADVGAL